MQQETVTYCGREYRLEQVQDNKYVLFILHGPRGAQYGLLPYINQPDHYYPLRLNTRRMTHLPGSFKLQDGILSEVV